MKKALFEAFEGRYDVSELSQMVNAEQIKKKALELILNEQKEKGN